MKALLSYCCALLLLLCMAQAAVAVTLDVGAYTAPAKTHYLNPDTGVTDDVGDNPELGEGMCRSAVGEEALIEVQAAAVYVTLRMQLASNLKNIQFSVQQTPGDPASYQAVPPEITAENAGENTLDYRFAVPSPQAVICCEMYVTPMGRDVKFYISLDAGAAVSGKNDFVTSLPGAGNTDSNRTAETGADYEHHWGAAYISAVLDRGLVDILSEGRYAPEQNVTRRVFLTGLARLSSVEATPVETGFSDVPASAPDAAYIAWGSESGIVNGKGEGVFAPDDSITREEMAAMLCRYLGVQGRETSGAVAEPFADDSAISSWARDAVYEVRAAGLIQGKENNRFEPGLTATRAEYAVILRNCMELVS